MHRYSIAVFLSAFLLFQVQPLVAKVILPWFGGTAAVWNTCMMFFQIVLLLGYLYSHGLRMLTKPKTSWIIHSVVLLLALLMLPVLPSENLKPDEYTSLTGEIVKVLMLSAGVPFFILATTGPLIQAWQSVSHGGGSDTERSVSPYRLYALSNIGSLLALVSYPFLFEPNLSVQHQSWIWTVLFALFVVSCIFSGMQIRASESWNTDLESDENSQYVNVSVGHMLMWLVLAMLPSVLLLATTNLMCQEIASVPFLWILPLALYLLSFIICFEKPALYHRAFFLPLLLVGVGAGISVVMLNVYASATVQILLLALCLFACGMTCHGELERLKPHASRLTLFYLFVSLGGSLGGIFVVLVAPRIFTGFPEFQLALMATLVCGIGVFCFQNTISLGRKLVVAFAGLLVGGLVLASFIETLNRGHGESVLFIGRNEYGIFSVETKDNRRVFVSGQIDHGSQIFNPEPSLETHSYYCEGSGFALSVQLQREKALAETPQRNGIKIGVLGLGIGSMLSWAEPEDKFVFYEINPRVEEIAREWFTFLPTYNDQCDVVIGDGRIMLEKELKEGSGHEFDVLAIDAFSSDSIPIHLLTDECFNVYEQHLKEDGILLFHISNRFIDLKPVIFSTTKSRGLTATYVENLTNNPQDWGSDWILVSNDKIANHPLIKSARKEYMLPENAPRWTDDFASLAPVINWAPSISWNKMFEQAAQNSKAESDPSDGTRNKSD